MKFVGLLILLSMLSSCGTLSKQENKVKIISVSEVNWEKLNPARGDQSPQAGTLWGARNGDGEPTGFLAKFVDGFSSPPHIHNVSYRAIVISGLIHNDDPKAANMWMPQGSYWSQPAGEAHITSAKGGTNFALVEIDSAPYLVKPTKDAFDNGERAINVHSSNIIWRDEGSFKVTEIWKNKKQEVTGSLLKFSGSKDLDALKSRIVLIKGELDLQGRVLRPGSLITVSEATKLKLVCRFDLECILYKKYD